MPGLLRVETILKDARDVESGDELKDLETMLKDARGVESRVLKEARDVEGGRDDIERCQG